MTTPPPSPFAPTGHHPDGPSTFPMRAECICYEAPADDPEDLDTPEEEQPKDAKARGTAKHQAVAMLFSADPEVKRKAFDGLLDDREREEVQWVAAKVVQIVESMGYTAADLVVEQRVTLIDGEFRVIYFGTCDGEAGPIDFDWKFGFARNYFTQHAGYALPKMEQRGEARRFAFTVYGRLRRVERHVITLETARTVVYGLLARRAAPDRRPTPCQYCGWCAARTTCSAFVQTPVTLVDRRDDWGLKLPTPHVSDMHDPAWVGAALFIKRRFLEKWCDGVDYVAAGMASRGIVPVGFTAQPWKGRTTITDVERAFRALTASGLVPESVLWDAMDLPLSKLAKAFADAAEISDAKALGILKRHLEEAGVLKTEEPALRLVADKDAEGMIRAALSDVFRRGQTLPEKGSDISGE